MYIDKEFIWIILAVAGLIIFGYAYHKDRAQAIVVTSILMAYLLALWLFGGWGLLVVTLGIFVIGFIALFIGFKIYLPKNKKPLKKKNK